MSLDPRPIGWFAVGFADELARGPIQGILADGAFRVSPELRCEGTATVAQIHNGVVFAWHHPAGAQPDWEVPTLPEDGWRAPLRWERDARSHPQETYENSIDTAHFPVIHGYADIETLQPMLCDGHEMTVAYRIRRESPFPGLSQSLAAAFEVHLHGLGVAHNHVEVAALGLKVRMLALSTPTRAGHVRLRLSVSVAEQLRLPFQRLLLPIIHRATMKGIVHDFEQDLSVWENKAYSERPLLTGDDGPIGRFRQWCQQFYRPAEARG